MVYIVHAAVSIFENLRMTQVFKIYNIINKIGVDETHFQHTNFSIDKVLPKPETIDRS